MLKYAFAIIVSILLPAGFGMVSAQTPTPTNCEWTEEVEGPGGTTVIREHTAQEGGLVTYNGASFVCSAGTFVLPEDYVAPDVAPACEWTEEVEGPGGTTVIREHTAQEGSLVTYNGASFVCSAGTFVLSEDYVAPDVTETLWTGSSGSVDLSGWSGSSTGTGSATLCLTPRSIMAMYDENEVVRAYTAPNSPIPFMGWDTQGRMILEYQGASLHLGQADSMNIYLTPSDCVAR